MLNFFQLFQDKVLEMIILPVLITIGIISAPIIAPVITPKHEDTVEESVVKIVEEKEIIVTPVKNLPPEKVKKNNIGISSQINKTSVTKESENIHEEIAVKENPKEKEPQPLKQTNSTVTLPNGSIVEINSTGQIVRYIKRVQLNSPVESKKIKTKKSKKEKPEGWYSINRPCYDINKYYFAESSKKCVLLPFFRQNNNYNPPTKISDRCYSHSIDIKRGDKNCK